MIENGDEPALATMTQASSRSESLSSPESVAAQTIAFGLVASVAALVALYLSYRQLRIMRSRCDRSPAQGDPEDAPLPGTLTSAYPLSHRGAGAGAGYIQEAPDQEYFLQITRSHAIQQVTVRARELPFNTTTWARVRNLLDTLSHAP